MSSVKRKYKVYRFLDNVDRQTIQFSTIFTVFSKVLTHDNDLVRRLNQSWSETFGLKFFMCKIWDFYLLLVQGVHQYCHVTGKNLMTGQEVRRNSVNAEIQQIV